MNVFLLKIPAIIRIIHANVMLYSFSVFPLPFDNLAMTTYNHCMVHQFLHEGMLYQVWDCKTGSVVGRVAFFHRQ